MDLGKGVGDTDPSVGSVAGRTARTRWHSGVGKWLEPEGGRTEIAQGFRLLVFTATLSPDRPA